tara:strand:+ start:3124 stop:3792 length:669 start_codon:yes stop_codon:yes gene_type:complete
MELNMAISWENFLEKEFSKDYFKALSSFIASERKENPNSIFPDENKVFEALKNCSLEKVKVVIIGQDPYPSKGHANGLCFSVTKEVTPLPKSLKNIFKELYSDVGVQKSDGDLLSWAKQGVLLLNTVLTVRESEAGSHANRGWEIFTDAIIVELMKERKNIVFILWGAKAQKKGSQVDERTHFIIKSPHPSPLSSYRGFFGSRPFSQVNDYLLSIGESTIDW